MLRIATYALSKFYEGKLQLPFDQTKHAFSGTDQCIQLLVWEDLLGGISPRQLVRASPRTPLLETLVVKDSDEKRQENFSKNCHESCTCFIEYAETDYLKGVTGNIRWGK